MPSAAVYVPDRVLRLRVLSWNLGPGNARWQELAAVLAGWDWDVSVLRRLPGRWPLPLATALDAEFRFAPAGRGERARMRRVLGWRPFSPAVAGGEVDAILARRDRIVSEWPADARQARRTGIHVAGLACGVWIGSLTGAAPGPALTPELRLATQHAALVLTGPRSLREVSLAEVARGGEDAIWATADLRPVSAVDVLAGGAVWSNPPLAVTLEHRVAPAAIGPDPPRPDSAPG